MESLYYILPGILRRIIWRYILHHSRLAFSKIGNVAISSVGMIGNVGGWFLPISVHPVCFGIGSVIRKPKVIKDEVIIRKVLYMSILMDHDVADGGMMARFVDSLATHIESGKGL